MSEINRGHLAGLELAAAYATLAPSTGWVSIDSLRYLIDQAQGAPEPAATVALSRSRLNRVYLAGPMTGLPDYNFPAFKTAAHLLRSLGYQVENPAEHGVVAGAEWSDYLRYDIARLVTCESIHLLPGWSASKGARLEVSIAGALGMHFSYAEGAETAPGAV